MTADAFLLRLVRRPIANYGRQSASFAPLMDAGGSLEEPERPLVLSQPEVVGAHRLHLYRSLPTCAGSLEYIAIASRGSYEHTLTLGRRNKSNT
ncbi:hypothetical protein HaLaN_17405 [Haematococcus lacustris]|uniref:Uncharacterized protein n=1 Tax=Haematococcus lacustris TaxID=44745 RepID=A0A699ZL55_HAELA|nr:hypothetical protein HaLaN_17405 [Haematococcus lacustris]